MKILITGVVGFIGFHTAKASLLRGDVVDALVLSGFSRTFGEIYNVCTGRKTTVGEALDLIKSAFNVDNNYPIEILDRTSRDIDSSFGSYEKISKEYG